jgi:hypothetical protein
VLAVGLLGFSEAGLLMVGADKFEFSVAEPQKQIPITSLDMPFSCRWLAFVIAERHEPRPS